MRPVYLLSYIWQPMIYQYQRPKPAEKKVEENPASIPEPISEEVPEEPIAFEGYPNNNLVLFDVSASMNKPDDCCSWKNLTQIINSCAGKMRSALWFIQIKPTQCYRLLLPATQ